MKTLKPIEHYLIPKSKGQASVIFFPNFIKDGIDLTMEEGLMLGGLEYNGLQGEIPVIENGNSKYIKVHPIAEVCYEIMASERIYNKIPESLLLHLAFAFRMTLEEFKSHNAGSMAKAKSILFKLGVDIEPIQTGIDQGVGLLTRS